jgi:hypothetical protein
LPVPVSPAQHRRDMGCPGMKDASRPICAQG